MIQAADSRSLERLSTAVLLAIAAHAFVLLGVSFELEPTARQEAPRRNLEILVVRQPAPPIETNSEPDFLAQTQQEAGGPESDEPRKPKLEQLIQHGPLAKPPAPQERMPVAQPAPAKPPAQPVLSARKKPVKVAAAKPLRPPPVEKALPSASELLASTRTEAARITAELDRRTELYSKRPRRKRISASTQEYKYAAYLEAWRRKVERIGNLNYPEEAKRKKLYGNLVLTVALRPDGSVDGILLTRSSGHKLLDDAAIRIVRLAAPFAPFPEEIRAETDILEITRTWQFLSSNRLFSER